MKLLRALLALALCLGAQAALGRLWPGAHRFVDFMLVPVVWYGIAGSQRSGMAMGCAAGLIHDTWFQIGTFGMSGFKRTLIGWFLGGLGSRFDLNHVTGRFLGGLAASLADGVMTFGLRRMLEQSGASAGLGELLLRAVVTGLLVAASFELALRFHRPSQERRVA
ncbi:MAG: rod shape-determining protein MreD [bacterium]|nr:rod shape-determining protein MreD [bacterium]